SVAAKARRWPSSFSEAFALALPVVFSPRLWGGKAMKSAVAMLALALAACGDAAEESDDPVPAATEVASGGWTGVYEFETGGQKTTSTLMADGTFTDTVGDEVVQSGQWEERPDGKVCFDPVGD